MKLIVVMSMALAVAFGQSCDSSFKGFMDCLAATTGNSAKGKVLEQEFDDDFVAQVSSCFDSSLTGSNAKCVLSRANLDSDVYGDDGPLHGCPKCQEIAHDIRDRIFKAPESVRKCFRVKFTAAVVNDLQPCIRNQLNDQSFSIPAMPDFDAGSAAFANLIEQSTSHRIMAYSRLSLCKEKSPQRAKVTEECMKNKKGYYKKRCELTHSCVSSAVSSSCKSTFTKTKDATCTCLALKRAEWHDRLEKVRQAVFNPEKSSTVCASGVKSALGHWVQDFDDIAKACPAPADPNSKIPNLPIGKLIDAGCIVGVEAANKDANSQSQLLSGFRMVTEVLDALNDRVTSFCDINCF